MQIFSYFTAGNKDIKPFPFFSELSMEAYILEHQKVLEFRDTKNSEIFGEPKILAHELKLKTSRKP